MPAKTVLRLREHEERRLPREALSEEAGERLWRLYGKQVEVGFPSPRSDHMWELRSNGWVGFIPLCPDLGLMLEPKVPIANLFGMLAVAYQLKGFRFLDGLLGCGDLEGYFDQMASILAKRILDRGRKGYYRTYVEQRGDLPYLRGRVDVARMARTPWRIQLDCEFQEHTGDVVENQILTWTLWCLAQSGRCSPEALRYVRKAYRDLAGIAATTPHLSAECVRRLYNRLNQDYEPLHVLCRFFLEHMTIPSTTAGGQQVLPFLIDMPRLFEVFVAKWLENRVPSEWLLRPQYKVVLDVGQDLQFRIDLVVEDARSGRALCVLDTKHKDPKAIKPDDVQQAVAYAEARGVTNAVLIYPAPPPLTRTRAGRVSVHFLAFDLSGDLNEAGHRLLDNLRAIVS